MFAVTGPPSADLDCLKCGACCTSRSARHIPVTGADWGRLGNEVEELTDWTENHAFMQMHAGHCIALDVEENGARCMIYSDRPEVCRALERGGPACEVERARKLPIVR